MHVAEALGVPLHMMFPQPWTKTCEFPHPMSGLTFDRSAELNARSYIAVDNVLWLGNAAMINTWRRQVLRLKETRVGTLSGLLLTRLKVPFSYMWSPSFVPKPRDWPPFVEVVGTFAVDQAGMNHPPRTPRPESPAARSPAHWRHPQVWSVSPPRAHLAR